MLGDLPPFRLKFLRPPKASSPVFPFVYTGFVTTQPGAGVHVSVYVGTGTSNSSSALF